MFIQATILIMVSILFVFCTLVNYCVMYLYQFALAVDVGTVSILALLYQNHFSINIFLEVCRRIKVLFWIIEPK